MYSSMRSVGVTSEQMIDKGLLSNTFCPASFISPLKNSLIISAIGVPTGQPIWHFGFLQSKHVCAEFIICCIVFSLKNIYAQIITNKLNF